LLLLLPGSSLLILASIRYRSFCAVLVAVNFHLSLSRSLSSFSVPFEAPVAFLFLGFSLFGKSVFLFSSWRKQKKRNKGRSIFFMFVKKVLDSLASLLLLLLPLSCFAVLGVSKDLPLPPSVHFFV
jgi:hypothetical protein